MKKNNFQKILNYSVLTFVGVLIVYLPLQALFQAYLERFFCNQSLVFWLSHWYEPVAAIFLILVMINFLSKKEIIIDKYYLIVGALIDFGIISTVFISPTISRGLEGFRFALFASLIFFIVMLIDAKKEDFEKLVKNYLTISVIIAVWAIVERALPVDYWQYLGLSDFGFGQHKVVDVYQSQSILEGPNQLASYLLPAIFLMLINITDKIFNEISKSKNKVTNQIPNIIFLLVIVTALILTFSRSAFVGLIVSLLAYILFFLGNKTAKYYFLGLALVATLGLYFLFQTGSAQTKDLFSHGASLEEHITALSESVNEVKNRFQTDTLKFTFGSGLGTAGPSVLKYGDGFVSESWYLQIFIELGLVGLALWLLLMYYLLRDLMRDKKGLFLGLLSVSVAALFLHTWADNPALALTLFILIGIIVKANTKNQILNPK